MSTGYVIVIIWAIGLPLTVVQLKSFSTRTSRRIATPSDSSVVLARFTGGMSFKRVGGGGGNATTPLVALSLLGWGVRLGPSRRFLEWVVPTLELRYSEIEVVSVVSGPRFKNSGVLLRAPTSSVMVVMWTAQTAALTDDLERHGVRVAPGVAKFTRWADSG